MLSAQICRALALINNQHQVILDWAKQGVTYEFSPQSLNQAQVKTLRAQAEPFVEWLKEADEDEEEDE